MKIFFTCCSFFFFLLLSAQKHVYDIELFGKKIGSTVIERIDKGNGEVEFKLNSSSEVNIVFTHKSSVMNMDVVYKDGKLISSYCKNVKDDVTEVCTIAWDGVKYIIKKGQDIIQLNHPVDYSTLALYFSEPVGLAKIFSERLGQYVNFQSLGRGVYQCVLDNGVTNTYHYRNGMLYELEMSKGASVFLKLVH